MSLWLASAGAATLVLLASRRRRRKHTPAASAVVEGSALPDSAPALTVVQLLDTFLSETPKPGYFYIVRDGDTLFDVAKRALETLGPTTRNAILSYIYCIQSGPKHNMRLYGTPSTSLDFPKEFLVPGKGTGIRVAFLPRNADALALMRKGRAVPRTVGKVKGEALTTDSSLGLPWLPPVDVVDGEPTCAPFNWDDGSSTIDPPPQLLSLLEAA